MSYQNSEILAQAKRYSSLKYCLAIIESIYSLALIFIFLSSGLSKILASRISEVIENNYLIILIYYAIVYLGYYLLEFPLNFYRSFRLEHRFSLSKQNISDWFCDQIKIGLITYIIGLILLEVFYFILKRYPNSWWIGASLFWIFFSLILARLLPIVIIPIFFKYKRFSDDSLRRKILNLAAQMRIKILDVFEIDLSKKTLKANAAFVGWGRTKRVILADTLKDKYTASEIEVILAHEFAHYRLKHLFKLIGVNSLTVILSFYLIFRTSNYFLSRAGFASLSDIAALPIILIYWIILGIIMQPWENYMSRKLERNADSLALKTTGLKEAFISLMQKLSSQNLADTNPHTLIKIFFFDHPPIDERISLAESPGLS